MNFREFLNEGLDKSKYEVFKIGESTRDQGKRVQIAEVYVSKTKEARSQFVTDGNAYQDLTILDYNNKKGQTMNFDWTIDYEKVQKIGKLAIQEDILVTAIYDREFEEEMMTASKRTKERWLSKNTEQFYGNYDSSKDIKQLEKVRNEIKQLLK